MAPTSLVFFFFETPTSLVLQPIYIVQKLSRRSVIHSIYERKLQQNGQWVMFSFQIFLIKFYSRRTSKLSFTTIYFILFCFTRKYCSGCFLLTFCILLQSNRRRIKNVLILIQQSQWMITSIFLISLGGVYWDEALKMEVSLRKHNDALLEVLIILPPFFFFFYIFRK